MRVWPPWMIGLLLVLSACGTGNSPNQTASETLDWGLAFTSTAQTHLIRCVQGMERSTLLFTPVQATLHVTLLSAPHLQTLAELQDRSEIEDESLYALLRLDLHTTEGDVLRLRDDSGGFVALDEFRYVFVPPAADDEDLVTLTMEGNRYLPMNALNERDVYAAGQIVPMAFPPRSTATNGTLTAQIIVLPPFDCLSGNVQTFRLTMPIVNEELATLAARYGDFDTRLSPAHRESLRHFLLTDFLYNEIVVEPSATPE